MSLLTCDGYDLYATTADLAFFYANAPYGGVLSAKLNLTSGRFGGGAIIDVGSGSTTATGDLIKRIPSTTEFWVGFACNLQTLYSRETPIISFTSSIGGECVISYQYVTGVWNVRIGNASGYGGTGAVIATATSAMTTSAWHWLEFHFKLDGATGIVEIWVDNIRILNATGLNTKLNSSATGIINMHFGGDATIWEPGGGSFLGSSMDDLYILDLNGPAPLNTRLGDSRIGTLVPASDAGPNDGTLTSGTNHFAVLNELQWNTTTYSTIVNTAGKSECCGVTSLTYTPAQIFAVRVLAVMQKTDSGAATGKVGIKSGSTSSYSANIIPLTTWQGFDALFSTDPNTSLAWTVSGVNNSKIRYDVV